MRTPIFNVISLAIPTLVGTYGYVWARTTKGTTNVGEAIFLTIAAVVGEVAAVVSLVRGERLGWRSWLGVAVNVALLMPAAYLLLEA